MRISDSQPSSGDPTVSDHSNSREKTEGGEKSTFSKTLAKKRDGSKDTDPFPSLQDNRKSYAESTSPGLVDSQQQTMDRSIQTAEIESKHIVAVPPELQQVVREISVAINAAGNHQVQIELNSTALKGLKINIEKQAEGVAIQFQSNSDQVSGLLSKNVESLVQGLGDRGVTVSNISINGPRDAARSQDSDKRGYSGNQSGRQGRGR
jgi:flagellar hook-length control protein FliK